MRIDYTKFSGEAPIAAPISLPEGFAQLAINCDLSGGTLGPLRGPRDIKALGVVGVKSLYKFGSESEVEGDWWFAFDQPVSVAKTQIFGDVEERTYFTGPWPTGPSKLRKTRADLAIQGAGPYPVAWLDGGIPAPGSALTVSASGGSTAVEPESRVYTVAFVTTWDEESEPGPASPRVVVNVGGTVVVGGLPALPAGAHAIDRIRLYRSVYVGDEEGDVRLVVELPVGTTSFSDDIATENLPSNVLQTTGWDGPPEGLEGLMNLPNQMAVAYKGFDVYFCVPQAYYAWPVANAQALDGKVMGLGGYGQALVALTKNKTFVGYGTDPESINLVKAEIPPECAGTTSTRSVVSETGGVVYANRFGLVSLSSGGANLVTKLWVGEKEWAQFSPDTMLGILNGGSYIGFYQSGDYSGGVIVDPDGAGLVRTSVYATAAHQFNGRTYLAIADRLAAWGEGSYLPYTWRSRRAVLPRDACMSYIRVIADSYPVQVKVIANGKLRATKTVESDAVHNLKTGYSADNFEIEVSGLARVRRITMAETTEELGDVAA